MIHTPVADGQDLAMYVQQTVPLLVYQILHPETQTLQSLRLADLNLWQHPCFSSLEYIHHTPHFYYCFYFDFYASVAFLNESCRSYLNTNSSAGKSLTGVGVFRVSVICAGVATVSANANVDVARVPSNVVVLVVPCVRDAAVLLPFVALRVLPAV